MALRRRQLQAALGPGEEVVTLTSFPRLGAGEHTEPPSAARRGGPVARSRFVADDVITPHPRFASLTRNIRERRGERVEVLVPVYMDTHTGAPADTAAASAAPRAHRLPPPAFAFTVLTTAIGEPLAE